MAPLSLLISRATGRVWGKQASCKPGGLKNRTSAECAEIGEHSPPAGGTTWSSSFMLVRFQIFLIMARNSSLACSRFPDGKEMRG